MARVPRPTPIKPPAAPATPTAAGPASAPLVGTGSGPAAKLEDVEVHRRFVEGLVLRGAMLTRIVTLARQGWTDPQVPGRRFTIGDATVKRMHRDVCAAIREEVDGTSKDSRRDQIARLRDDLLRMRSDPKTSWTALSTHEKLVAEVEGNLAPRRLTLEVGPVPDALAASIAGMTPEAIEQALAEELEREKKLRAIDVQGQAVP